jgi:DNA-binding XRE family transcriptional regulator
VVLIIKAIRGLKMDNIKTEGYYWNKQIERHRVGKEVRGMCRKMNIGFTDMAILLGVSRKTIWAVCNGLTVVGKGLRKKIKNFK